MSNSVAVVIPTYKAKPYILEVLAAIPKFVDFIFVIDDACPDRTGQFVQNQFEDKRLRVIQLSENQGVGGATIVGFTEALNCGADIIVKLDSDGQMDPEEINRLIEPIDLGEADFVKGNRFNSLDDLQEMPKIRIFGNAILSLMSKISTGYWTINDPTNGFIAISGGALQRVDLMKLRKRWFFESDLLFRLAIIRAKVVDLPMKAKYRQEESNLVIRKIIPEFWWRHLINFHKRVFYIYYLREWSVVSIQLPAAVFLILFGTGAGVFFWDQGGATGVAATSGQVMLAVLPIILGFQLLLSVLGFDISNEPKEPIFRRRNGR